MFNIDIASLRDPATLARIKTSMVCAAATISAYEFGEADALTDTRYASGLNKILADVLREGISSPDLNRNINEAYNLGWDTVRLQRGVNKNAK